MVKLDIIIISMEKIKYNNYVSDCTLDFVKGQNKHDMKNILNILTTQG